MGAVEWLALEVNGHLGPALRGSSNGLQNRTPYRICLKIDPMGSA
jgi:hypothetical protein